MARSSPKHTAAISWLAALLSSALILAALDYRLRDADSRLHSEIAARMAPSPAAQWIAPQFPPGWFMGGPYREHPVGIHLLPASLARLGYPPGQASPALSGVYVVLGLVLLQRLAATVVSATEAGAVALFAQLLPIAFTFRIRANHEPAVLACLLLALYGIERSRRQAVWGIAAVVGLVAFLLVKGVFVVMGFAACALWLLARRRSEPEVRAGRAWAALFASLLAVGLVALVYEHLYRQAAGLPFWSFYLGRQMGVAAVDQSASGVAQKAYNLVWYLGRVLWFPFPWSLALVAALLAQRGRARATTDAGTRTGVLFVLGFSLLYIGLFSLSDRRADRYIFPVYYVVGAAGVVAALRAWPRLRSFTEDSLRRPWIPAVLWLALFALHILGGQLGIPTVKVWAPDS